MSEIEKEAIDYAYTAECAKWIEEIADNHSAGWWEPRLDSQTGMPRYVQFAMASKDPFSSKKFLFDLQRFSFMAYGLYVTRENYGSAARDYGLPRKTDIVLEVLRQHKANFQFSRSFADSEYDSTVLTPGSLEPQGYTTLETFKPSAILADSKVKPFEVPVGGDIGKIEIDPYAVRTIGIVEFPTLTFLIIQRHSSGSNIAIAFTDKERAGEHLGRFMVDYQNVVGTDTGELIIRKL